MFYQMLVKIMKQLLKSVLSLFGKFFKSSFGKFLSTFIFWLFIAFLLSYAFFTINQI